MTNRVLITGASGFIGPHAVRALIGRGYDVHATGYGPAPADIPDPATYHDADLLRPGAPTALINAIQPTHILHMAWYAVHGKFWTAPENLDWVRASLELYRAFAARGGQHFVASGTCAEYDWSHTELIENHTPTHPATLYGRAKDALRTMIEDSADSLGVSWAWGRVFFLYGPNEAPNRLVPHIIRTLLDGKPAELSHGQQQRDFMHSADVGRALAALLDSDVTGPVNIASGRTLPIANVAELIGSAIGTPELIKLGVRPAPEGDPPRLAADATRLLSEVGYQPVFDLETGLADAIGWWRAHTSR
jgi:nucleoside-diphosphate-sugar epimerase